MTSFKRCTLLSLILSACLALPGHSETALIAGVGSHDCTPLPAPAEQVGFVQAPLSITRNGLKINAVLAQPADVPAKAVVVFLHGYTGTLDELPTRNGDGIFLRAARAFARQGIASLRFDFIGSGDSDGVWADTTFSGQAADTEAVLKALSAQDDLDGLPIHLLGFSQGGLVALQTAAKGLPVRSVVLWNPVLDPRQTFGHIFSPEGRDAGLALAKAGDFDAMVPGTRLKASFFAEIETAEPIKTGAEFTQPVLAISGTLDGIADNGAANAEKLKRQRRGSTMIVSVAGDHALGARRSTTVIDEVIACSISFVAQRSGILGKGSSLAPLQ